MADTQDSSQVIPVPAPRVHCCCVHCVPGKRLAQVTLYALPWVLLGAFLLWRSGAARRIVGRAGRMSATAAGVTARQLADFAAAVETWLRSEGY